MSVLGSLADSSSNCAHTRFAETSSTWVPRKTIRSASSSAARWSSNLVGGVSVSAARGLAGEPQPVISGAIGAPCGRAAPSAAGPSTVSPVEQPGQQSWPAADSPMAERPVRHSRPNPGILTLAHVRRYIWPVFRYDVPISERGNVCELQPGGGE